MKKSDEPYLSSGFADVDSSSDVKHFSGCLSLLDSLPYFKEYKRETYDLLQLSSGLSVLDLGCGIGDDAVRIAKMIAPGGEVVGVDASAAMIEQAAARDDLDSGRVRFQCGDVRALPFKDSSFDRCRVDRVLQHVAEPFKAVSEMNRVLRSGGYAVAYDNDWGTFSINSMEVEVTKRIEEFWTGSFTNPWIGRFLRPYFIDAGFEEVAIYPSNSIISEFDLADKVYSLRQTVQGAMKEKLITKEEGKGWLEELLDLTKRRGFTCALTAYIVVGRKP